MVHLLRIAVLAVVVAMLATGASAADSGQVQQLRKAAADGSAEASFKLGVIYGTGDGVVKDSAAAAQWYLDAGQRGFGPAFFNLGLMHRWGDGVPADYEQASRFYLRGAELDDPDAANEFRRALAAGFPKPADEAEAVSWARFREGGFSGFSCYRGGQPDPGYKGLDGRRCGSLGLDPAEPYDRDAAIAFHESRSERGDVASMKRLASIWSHRAFLLQTGNAVSEAFPNKAANEQVQYWTTRAAEAGDVESMATLATLHSRGFQAEQDLALASRWRVRAAELGHQGAAWDLAMDYARGGMGVPQSDRDALRWAAAAGHADPVAAQLEIGRRLLTDAAGFWDDPKTALRWMRMAAEAGNVEAMVGVGYIYAQGKGVRRNDREAARWYRMAADKGDVQGLFNLANIHVAGRGMPRNGREAVRLYEQAAAKGSLQAKLALGHMYATGQVVRRDVDQALRWYSMAADDGDWSAGMVLAMAFAGGGFAGDDDVEALRRMVKAAEGSEAEAAMAIAENFASNRFITSQDPPTFRTRVVRVAEVDDRQSMRWMLRAAELGNREAMAELSDNLSEGWNGRTDHVAAIHWADRAALGAPLDLEAIVRRCGTRARGGVELDLALTLCQQALGLVANRSDIAEYISIVHIKRGEPAAAEAALRPEPPEYDRYGRARRLFLRGSARIAQGNVKEGRADLTAASKLDRNVVAEMRGIGLPKPRQPAGACYRRSCVPP